MAESELGDTKTQSEEVLEEEFQESIPDELDFANLLKQFTVSLMVAGAFITNKYTLPMVRIIERKEIEELAILMPIPMTYLENRTKCIHGLNQWCCR